MMRSRQKIRAGWWSAVSVAGALALAGCTTPVFQNGRALLPVIVATDAAPEERAAAEELGRVLGLMSGLVWPVRAAAHNGERGFYVGSPARLGCACKMSLREGPQSGPTKQSRWIATARSYGPRDDKAFCKHTMDVTLHLAADILAPKAGEIGPDGFRISSRNGSVFIEGATPEATGFAVAWLLQHKGGVRWYAPGAGGEVIPHRTQWRLPRLDEVHEPAYVSREIYGAGTAQGSDWARRNGLRGRLEFTHALTAVFTRENLTANPDWAPLVRGKRNQPASADDYYWQPNLALPAVAEHAAHAAVTTFTREPARPSFSLGMNDSVRFDQSAATRALVEPLRYFRGMPDYSPLVFTFMNRAAQAVARSHPERYLGCLAYFWSENPPPFPVHPQVLPYVTTDRAQYYDSAYREADLALMSRWGDSGARAYGLWEYGYGQGFLVPRVPHRALADAIREGWQRGARGYFADTGPQGGFDCFKVWMLAQLLWEPTRSYEELADDYFPGYYGPAAGPMRRFFERCEAQWMAQSGPPYWLKLHQHEDQALLFPSEVGAELRALLQQAEHATARDPVFTARVAQTSQAFAVTEAFVEFDVIRRQLAAGEDRDELAIATLIRRQLAARTRLEEAVAVAHGGESPAMTQNGLTAFVRNDPVPRLLWLAGRRDPTAPQRLLAAVPASSWSWWTENDLISRLAAAPNLAANGSFCESAPARLEPAFLHPLSGELPARWEVQAMPTETSRVLLGEIDPSESARALRIEGAWDTQVFQWQPSEAGQVYLARAQLRGCSSPGGDAALFLTFLNAAGQVVGTHRMQSLPKGLTSRWWQAVLADRAPADARWVGLGVGASRQVSGDWLEVISLELRSVKGEALQ